MKFIWLLFKSWNVCVFQYAGLLYIWLVSDRPRPLMRSYVGGLARHPTIFTFSRFWRIFVTSAPIFAPSGVLRCHHLLTAVFHQCYVPLVIILQLCVVVPAKRNAIKTMIIGLKTNLLASSSTFQSLGESSAKDGLHVVDCTNYANSQIQIVER